MSVADALRCAGPRRNVSWALLVLGLFVAGCGGDGKDSEVECPAPPAEECVSELNATYRCTDCGVFHCTGGGCSIRDYDCEWRKDWIPCSCLTDAGDVNTADTDCQSVTD